MKWIVCFTVALSILGFKNVDGLLRRCVNCRSRGELGSCKDPFTTNITLIEKEHGVEAIPCASGWCGKIIESPNLNNEYGTATQRMCLQRGPDDGEERCAYTMKNYKNVYMCFCRGDLCNSSTTVTPNIICIIALIILQVSR
ncbi:uncharacterized protein LOC130672917 [Microplitis mediator]|uniref:uncharacterized protein LOC130672917 n=1 Tax=Microplitis mediator TaxID=375433 RepID=UPI0025567D56|nr:uncharacterized protein LOC130672917 [Microplitis mediator]